MTTSKNKQGWDAWVKFGLTKKQVKLLQAIFDYRNLNNERPTLKNLVETVGLAHNRSVIDMIRLLVDKGYLIPGTKVTYSLQLTAQAYKVITHTPAPIIYRLPWQTYQASGGTHDI